MEKTNRQRFAERLLDMEPAEVESILALFSASERETIVSAVCDAWHQRNKRTAPPMSTDVPRKAVRTDNPIKLWYYHGLVYVIRDGVLQIFPKMLDALIYLEVIRTMFTPRCRVVTMRDHLHPVTSLCDPTPIVKKKVIHIRIGVEE